MADTLTATLRCVAETPLALAMQQSEWLFPIVEVAHVLSLALLVGTIAMVDLRLMGFAYLSHRADDLMRVLLPWTWGAFAGAAITGTLLFVSAAERYAGNSAFQIKFALLAVAGINLSVFHVGVYRRVSQWAGRARPPATARFAGGLSLALWLAIVAAGRWIGFIT